MSELNRVAEIERAIHNHIRAAHGAGVRSGLNRGDSESITSIADTLTKLVLAFGCSSDLPDGLEDHSTIQAVTKELDLGDVPLADKTGRPYGITERVALLVSDHEEALGHIEELQGECDRVSLDFERDLWKANRRIIDRLGFDWKSVGSEGVTADEVEFFIMDAITALERKAIPRKKPLPVAVVGLGTGDQPSGAIPD